MMKMKIRVLRPFMLSGEAVAPDAIVEVTTSLAHELIHARKAEAVDDAPPVQPLSVENAGGLVAGQHKGDAAK
jgi:hypothetical protein